MKKQTYIVQHWYGADTYDEAGRKALDSNHNDLIACADFNRMSCKKVSTVLRYLANWRRQAKEYDLELLYPTLVRDDAHYAIVATPDGYHATKVVATGMMKDLENQYKEEAA